MELKKRTVKVQIEMEMPEDMSAYAICLHVRDIWRYSDSPCRVQILSVKDENGKELDEGG